MIPTEVAEILGILEDLLGERPTITRYPLKNVPDELWEGFVFDVQQELDVPGMEIAPSWNVWELYEHILAYREKEADKPELPESTLIIHLDDEHINSMLDDLETVLEKYNIPYVMKLYTHKDGGHLHKEPLLRASSHEEVFDKYHDRVMGMFQGKSSNGHN